MTQVQIDDFNCIICNKITMANLDMKTGKYTCLVCNENEEENDDGMEICYDCSHDQNHCICKSEEILDVLEEKEKTPFEKLQEENEKLRTNINKLVGVNNSPIWVLINGLIDNELEQEEMCVNNDN